MTKKHFLNVASIVTLSLLLAAGLAGIVKPAGAVQTIIQLGWTNPMATNDVAVSDDGNHLAAVNGTGLYYFGTEDSTPLWWFASEATAFRSVAISADGEYVVAGDGDGYIHYFDASTTRAGNQTEPTWESYDMGGPVERGTLDMSADGNYTVIGGTGFNVFYYAGCRTMTGTGRWPAWGDWVQVNDFLTVHISTDGRYVAGGGSRGSGQGFVVFYKDCSIQPYPTQPAWFARNQTTNQIVDLALSDDGYGVAAVDNTRGTLRYWANATVLSGDPNATWTNPGAFRCVDMRSDGDFLVAGSTAFTSLHFWSHARVRNGVEPEDWVNLNSTSVLDVAISHDGTTIAAPIETQSAEHYATFYSHDGTSIGNYSLLEASSMVSMSANGSTVAMAGPGWDSLYLFKILTDSTPPSINDIYQQPAEDNVQPEDRVRVFANITDDESGVDQVLLSFTNGNGTWFTNPMSPYQRDIWNGTIPAYPYLTNVTYRIIASDNANNTATSEAGYTLEYQVIPEHLTTLLAPLLITTTALALALKKRKLQTKTH